MSLKSQHSALGLPGYYEAEEQIGVNGGRGYIGWCPGDDGMSAAKGWGENKDFESWAAFKAGWGVHCDPDLNLIADFYFSHEARQRECGCEGTGLAPQAKVLSRSFHGGWSRALTQDEVDALIEGGRLPQGSTPESCRGGDHDAINRLIAVETRANRLGLPYLCAECHGKGSLPIEAENLVLRVWMLHPRKGLGRGLTIRNVREEDLPEIKAWVRKSYETHTRHFQWALEGGS